MSITTRKFKTVITETGAAKLAQAAAPNGLPVRLTHMAVGDGGGTLPTPDSKQIRLVNEVWRHSVNRISLDGTHLNRIIAELVIPPETGGFWIREIGVFDEHGDLIAVGNTAESYKPAVAEGSGRAQTFRTILTVSSAATVELTVDNTMVIASVDYVNNKLKEHEDSRNHPDATLEEKGFTQLSSETDSDSEELAATPKAVKAVMDNVRTKAPLDSPNLTGTPTATTPDLSATGHEIATAAFVAAKVAQLVDSSPEAMDTLKELAEALGNDPNFSTTMLNALAGKQPLHEILTSLSGLVTAGNKLPYFSDRNVMALANLTAVGRVLIGQNSKDEVLSYLGLVDTINRANGALQKDQNGADVPQPDWFVRNIGAARAFNGGIDIGGGGNWTTAEFIAWLKSQGAFNHPYWMCKGSWAYANNRIITDTGCGNIQLAGAVVEVMGDRGAMTVRVTTATTGEGILGAQFTYINHGDGYLPGWRRDLRRSGDTMDGDLNLPNLYASGIVKSAGEIQTTSANSFRMVYGDYGAFWHQNGTYLYLMLTNRGDPYGSFNGLRPLVVNLATGDVTMANGATIHNLKVQGNIGIGTDNALGANSIVLGDSDTGFRQDGDGILDIYSNGRQLIRVTPNAVQIFGWTGSWISMRDQPCITNHSPVSNDGAEAIIRQEHQDRHFILGGLGNHQFGIYMINKSRSVNGTDGQAYLDENGNWQCGGKIYPASYENFDGRYQPRGNYATQEWVLQNFVQNIDLTAPTEYQFWDGRGYMRATDGAAMYNFSMVGGANNVGWIVIRYTRRLINNVWYVIN